MTTWFKCTINWEVTLLSIWYNNTMNICYTPCENRLVNRVVTLVAWVLLVSEANCIKQVER